MEVFSKFQCLFIVLHIQWKFKKFKFIIKFLRMLYFSFNKSKVYSQRASVLNLNIHEYDANLNYSYKDNQNEIYDKDIILNQRINEIKKFFKPTKPMGVFSSLEHLIRIRHDYVILYCPDYYICLDWLDTSKVRIKISKQNPEKKNWEFLENKTNVKSKTVRDYITNVVIGKFLAYNKVYSTLYNNCIDFANIAFNE